MTAGSYLAAIWRSRYFWLNLVGADLRARWRRSTLGIFWTLLQPVGFALLLTFVLGRILGVGFGAVVVHHDVHPFGGQGQGDGLAHPVSRAGDQGNLIGQ